MIEDTGIGGSNARFPETCWSAIVASGSEDPAERSRAFDTIVSMYWKPVYKYIRIKWHKSNEDAKDLTQGFFAKSIEKDFFRSYDPAKARFRTFLRTCLDGFLANEEKAARRIKRGGEAVVLSLDFETAEGELRHHEPAVQESMDDYFEKEFTRSFFELAVDRLRSEMEGQGKQTHFLLFEKHDLEATIPSGRVSYAQLASEFSLPVTTVTNYLAAARKAFRRIVMTHVRSVTATDEEFRREARALLGVEVE
ncbi:MAG: sigma-70 family RNA polymerase sigma factor [Acidobacteria bacterium]|nr:sigma-70 family RNA polymerase sigma factor [Acidobacteriota bacterium]